MDRGQPERPADGSDDAIEAIEAVVAPAADDVADAPSEGGSSTEAPPPAFVPDGRPPAHWLAYIRARAPGLLKPVGGLAANVSPPPDVVPHGPAAHAAPWSPVHGGVPPRPAATPVPMGDRQAPAARAGDQVDPWAAEARPSLRAGSGSAGEQPAEPARSAAPRQGAGLPPLPGTPSTHHVDVPVGAVAPAGEDRGDWKAVNEPLRHEPERSDEGQVHEPDPDASLGDDATPAPGLAWNSRSTPDRLDAQTPAFPRPDGASVSRKDGPSHPRPEEPSYQRPAGSWPGFAAESHGSRDVDASWTSFEVSPSRATPSYPSARGPAPAARPTVGPLPPTFPPLPARSPAGTAAREARREDGWRVRATAPDTWSVARLELPPWPDLPESMPEADEPDWRSIERSLQRATRLDREQRRR